MNIVKKGMCVDFHIHSINSKHKEAKGLVDNNTIDKISDLVDNLTDTNNQVNMCAITDHDNFDFDMYKKLKSYESHKTLKKVLPGIEFTVSYKNMENGEVVPIHIVVLFNDSSLSALELIQEKVFDNEKNKPIYDLDNSFSESRFLKILAEIDLDVLMIAHQKNSPYSENKSDNDVLTVGEGRLGEFLFSGYFEAFEFRNRKNEIFNNVFMNENQKKVTFITGSDCHSWRDYPKEFVDEKSEEYKFTYLKCLPTFKGLAMALTDFSRIGSKDSFFSTDFSSLDSIQLKVNDDEIEVPLSKGINVIIGDNSIGKSMLVHKMTDYTYTKQLGLRSIDTKYDNYLEDNNLIVSTRINDNRIYGFDGQGYIRKQFEENKLKSTHFFSDKYPILPSYEEEKKKINSYFTSILQKIKKRFILSDSEMSLYKSFKFQVDTVKPQTIQFSETKTNNDVEIDNLKSFRNTITSTKLKVDELAKWTQYFNKSDRKAIVEFLEFLNSKKDFADLSESKLIRKNRVINKINTSINKIESELKHVRSESDKLIQSQKQFFDTFTINLKKTLTLNREFYQSKIIEYKDFAVKPESRDYYDYSFVSKISTLKYDSSYISDTWKKVFKKGKSQIDLTMITKQELINKIGNYDVNSKGPIEFINEKLLGFINDDFKRVDTIVRDGEDKTKEMSSGFNSAMYFDIISYDSYKNGIYIIDQPEDNVSQTMIKNQLISNFRRMRQNRQVIMITHNPQFVVNVDTDNVIFISKSKDTKKIKVCSGALEYEEAEYNILDIVAENLEGGRETINRRVRRYGK